MEVGLDEGEDPGIDSSGVRIAVSSITAAFGPLRSTLGISALSAR